MLIKRILPSVILMFAGVLTAQGQITNDAPQIKQVGQPKWWIVPFHEGNTQEGKLYLGALLENTSNVRAIAVITFRAYEADGTLFDACSDGVSVDIAPREKALATCQRSIVPRTTKDLQITARITYVNRLVGPALKADVFNSGLLTKSSDPQNSIYEAFALVRAKGNRDIQTEMLFRFYDENNVQIGVSESPVIILEPEVAQRVISSTLIVSAGSSQPKTVRVDIKGYAVN
jgi:hypothetical protein